jgi:hypothetical protein
VSARFDPDEIDIDGHAQLIIETVSDGRATEEGRLMANGLELRRLQAVRHKREDGKIVTTLFYHVTPQEIGTHALSGKMLLIDGEPVPIPSTQLVVHSAGSALLRQGQLSPLAQSMRLLMGPLPAVIYAGQTFPVDICLLAPKGLRIRVPENRFPQKIGEFFHWGAGGNTATPSITYATKRLENGEIHWRTLLTAVSSGDLPVAFILGLSVEAEANEPICSKKGVWRGWENLFSDKSHWLPVTVSTPQQNITVLPLPQVGRPADFSGAVGEFTLLSPQVLSIEDGGGGKNNILVVPIRGNGNLHGIHAPQLVLGEQWRLYRTGSAIHAEDTLGETGTIEFSYHIVPQKNNAILPTFIFSFFSPSSGRYEYLRHSFQLPDADFAKKNKPQPPSLLDILPLREDWGGPTFGRKPLGNNACFCAGNAAFASANYLLAKDFYESVSVEYRTAALLQNLSAAQAAIGNVGAAILNLRRALLIEPSNAELLLALNQLLAACQLPKFHSSHLQHIIHFFSSKQWRALAFLFATIVTVCVVILFFRRKKVFTGIIAIVLFGLFLLSLVSIAMLKISNSKGIILRDTEAYRIPSLRAPPVKILPEGSCVTVVGAANGLWTISCGGKDYLYICADNCSLLCR